MVAGGGLPKCRHFSNLQWPSVGSKWPSPTGRNQSNAKPRLSPGHFCASAFSNAAFFCIDPLDEPTQYATTLDAMPARVPSNKVTMSRWLAGTSSRITSHSMTAKPTNTMADTRMAP